MNRLGWMILIIISAVIFGKFFIRSTKTLQGIAPEKCSSDLDTIWSSGYQKKIAQSIQDSYQEHKNPQLVTQKITQTFPEISQMQAEICSADTICFHAQAAQPLCSLNDAFVLWENQVVSKKEHTDQDIFTRLPKVYAQNLNDYDQLIAFIKALPQELTHAYLIDWDTQHSIRFKPDNNQNMTLLVSTTLMPTVQLFADCHDLYQQNFKEGSKKKNNKTMVEYDIRFKNQIIIKSGGKYG